MLTNSSDLSALTSMVADPSSSFQHLNLPDRLAGMDDRADDMKRAFQEFVRAVLFAKGREFPSKALTSLLISRALILHHQFAEVCLALRYSSHLKELSVKLLLILC